MKEITLEQVNKYNQIIEAAKGTAAYTELALWQEYKPDEDISKRWLTAYPYCRISTYTDGMRFYIKNVNGKTYLYMDLDGSPADRYCLEGKYIAKRFFCS